MDLSHPPLSASPAPAAAGNESTAGSAPRWAARPEAFPSVRRCSPPATGESICWCRRAISSSSRCSRSNPQGKSHATTSSACSPGRGRRVGTSSHRRATAGSKTTHGCTGRTTCCISRWQRASRRKALGHATTVHPLLPNFDCLGWWRGALASRLEWKEGRSAVWKRASGARYSWTLFRPDREALDVLVAGMRERTFSLPVGICASF